MKEDLSWKTNMNNNNNISAITVLIGPNYKDRLFFSTRTTAIVTKSMYSTVEHELAF